MPRIDIKPLSVNAVWQGKRFKTPAYKKYERDMLLLMPELEVPDGALHVYYEFGFSSAASDIDNPVKPLQDILQKRYGFDDKRIQRLTIEKTKVKKGDEYLIYLITEYKQKAKKQR
jgi:Holliday junction resolvase RusA-like endonuclease